MDTKLKADIAESAVITELLKRGFNVLKPVGDRLPYDLAIDLHGSLVRLQVKCAWFNEKDEAYYVDVRRTKTNRRQMIRKRYGLNDFDFAILFILESHVFYIIPISAFMGFSSTISLVETKKRQREPKSREYRERWDFLSAWASQAEMVESTSVKFGEALNGNTEPSPANGGKGVETRWRTSSVV
ncbi:MAG: endonuclease [Bacteroidetes bacterium]|nr:endonuclease [Bacteroidota bacterium]